MSGRVLITGAAGALGRSVVQKFVAAGEQVLAVGDREAGLAELAAGLATPAGALAVQKADLTVTAEVDRLFAEAPAAVIHLVGGFRWGRFADLSDDDWSFLLKVNLDTT